MSKYFSTAKQTGLMRQSIKIKCYICEKEYERTRHWNKKYCSEKCERIYKKR